MSFDTAIVSVVIMIRNLIHFQRKTRCDHIFLHQNPQTSSVTLNTDFDKQQFLSALVQIRVVEKIVDCTMEHLENRCSECIQNQVNAPSTHLAPHRVRGDQNADIESTAHSNTGLRLQCWDFQFRPGFRQKIVNEVLVAFKH